VLYFHKRSHRPRKYAKRFVSGGQIREPLFAREFQSLLESAALHVMSWLNLLDLICAQALDPDRLDFWQSQVGLVDPVNLQRLLSLQREITFVGAPGLSGLLPSEHVRCQGWREAGVSASGTKPSRVVGSFSSSFSLSYTPSVGLGLLLKSSF
jgi:hypothetical protein